MRKALGAALLALAGLSAPGTAMAEPLTVLALGDSLTQGYGIEDPAQALTPQLQAWLARQGVQAEVINGGVSGDTTAGGLSRLDWLLSPEVDAVIVALGGNDLLRGVEPAQARANLEAILARLEARGLPVLLAGLPAPGNYGPVYKQDFDAIWPELAARHDAVLVENLLGPITDLTLAERARLDVMQDDNIHPAPDGVKLVVEGLGPKVMELLARVSHGS